MLEEHLKLAQELLAAADRRSTFSRGGDDQFLEVDIYFGNNMETYQRLCQEYNTLEDRFNQAVPDKRAFVNELRKLGHRVVAQRIAAMFLPLKELRLARMVAKRRPWYAGLLALVTK